MNQMDCQTEFDQNKGKKLMEWCTLRKMFPYQGNQAYTGIVRSNETGNEFVFKISREVDFSAEHENLVGQDLNSLSDFCVNFPKTYGITLADIDPFYEDINDKDDDADSSEDSSENDSSSEDSSDEESSEDMPDHIFDISKIQKPYVSPVLLIEKISKYTQFETFINTRDNSDEEIFSIIKQVLLLIKILQQEKGFVHYDLHPNNVLVRKCKPDTVFLYVIDENNQFAIPTYGNYPILIDNGYSYVRSMEDRPFFGNIEHTNALFTTYKFDPIADLRIFLISSSSCFKRRSWSKKRSKFRKLVKNVFKGMILDWDTGWGIDDGKSFIRYVGDLLQKRAASSVIFSQCSIGCVSAINSLLILPFEEVGFDDIYSNFGNFLSEWRKIEDTLTDPYKLACVFKDLCTIARTVRPDFFSENKDKAVVAVSREIFESLGRVARKCRPKNVNYDRMLTFLYKLAQNIEGIYHGMDMILTEKTKVELKYASCERLNGAIEVNFPDTYVYSDETNIIVQDLITKRKYRKNLSVSTSETLNTCHPFERGSVIYLN